MLFPLSSVHEGSRFSARLAVSPGDRFVRFNGRAVVRDVAQRRVTQRVTVHAPGLAPTSLKLPDAANPFLCQGEPTDTPCFGAVTPIEIALRAGAISEVVLDIARPGEFCGPPLPPEPAWLLDDLRAE